MQRAASVISQALADALSLVLPVDCVGCGDPGRALCGSCTPQLTPRRLERRLGSGLRVCSGLAFEGTTAAALRALKEQGRTELARALAPALSRAIAEQSYDAGRAVLVPVPSSRAAMRRRGFDVVGLLMRRAGMPAARLLVPQRATDDQRTLARGARRANVDGSLRARSAAGLEVVVVDDVVTTGATLDEAARALEAAGARVLGAATVAATPLRGRTPNS